MWQDVLVWRPCWGPDSWSLNWTTYWEIGQPRTICMCHKDDRGTWNSWPLCDRKNIWATYIIQKFFHIKNQEPTSDSEAVHCTGLMHFSCAYMYRFNVLCIKPVQCTASQNHQVHFQVYDHEVIPLPYNLEASLSKMVAKRF